MVEAMLAMFVARIPNRNSNPTWLIRRSKWVEGKSRKTTLTGITKLPESERNQIREVLRGAFVVHDLIDALKERFMFVRRLPQGHVAAALGMLRKLKLGPLIDSKPATVHALREESQTSSLGHEPGLSNVHENEICEAMDWLYARKDAIERQLAKRHLLTHARNREEVKPAGYDWITALRKPAIRTLVQQDGFQLSLVDGKDLAEVTSDDYPGERLIVCPGPLSAERAARKREQLLQATEKKMEKLVKAVHRAPTGSCPGVPPP